MTCDLGRTGIDHAADVLYSSGSSRSLQQQAATSAAHVAELVDAHGSGPCAARCGGSSPSVGTKIKKAGCASNRPFSFWRPRAKRLRALRERLESFALQGEAGSRNVTELPPWALKV